MAYILNTPISVNTSVNSRNITSFAVDITRAEIYVSYDDVDANNAALSQNTITISGLDFLTTISDANGFISAGDDYYTATKKALYKQIELQTGIVGVVA